MSGQVDIHCMCYFGHLSRDTEAKHEGCTGGQSLAVDFMYGTFFTVCVCSDELGPSVFDPLLLFEWSLIDA